jgi:hypothetical protein
MSEAERDKMKRIIIVLTFLLIGFLCLVDGPSGQAIGVLPYYARVKDVRSGLKAFALCQKKIT